MNLNLEMKFTDLKRDVENEIERLQKQNEIMKAALQAAYTKACDCCDSSECVKDHCDEALKQVEELEK